MGVTGLGQRIQELQAQIDAAIDESRYDDVIALMPTAMEETRQTANARALGLLHYQRGLALMQTNSGDRAENLDRSWAILEEALGRLTEDSDPEQ